MRTNRSLLPVLLAAAVALTVACSRHAAPVTESLSNSFPAADGKLVRIDLRSTDAGITVRPGDTIEVTAELSARSNSAAFSRRWVAEHRPVMEDSPGTLEIREPERKHGLFFVGFLHTRSHLTVTLPPSCRLEVRTTSGDVSLDGAAVTTATTRVETSSGDIAVSGGCTSLAVHTSSGDVDVSGPALASLDVESRSGDVRVTAEVGRVLAETTSGDLRFKHLAGSLSAVTGSGDVAATWSAAATAGDVTVRTRSGGVVVRLPGNTVFHGAATTRSGRISSRFDGEWSAHDRILTFPGEDGVTVSLSTTTGRISLLRTS